MIKTTDRLEMQPRYPRRETQGFMHTAYTMHRTGHQPEPSHTTHATTPRRPRPSFAVDRTGPDGKCASRDGAGPAERRRAAPPKRPFSYFQIMIPSE